MLTKFFIRIFLPINLFCLLILSGNANSNQTDESVDLLFKARALQSIEKMSKILDSIPKEKKGRPVGEAITPEQHCEMVLEDSYSRFADPDLWKIARKKMSNGAIFYRLAIVESKDIAVQVNFIYQSGKANPSGLSIPILKEGWSIFMNPDAPNMITVNGKKCGFIFKLSSPLNSEFFLTPK